MRHHFVPLGLFVSRFIFPRAMPWAFTFWAFGPDLMSPLRDDQRGLFFVERSEPVLDENIEAL